MLAVAGTTVIYLSPAPNSGARLAAVDATTGRERWRSRAGRLSSWPGICADDAQTVCLSGEGAELRFGVQTGELLQALQIAPTTAGREIGRGLYDPAERRPELLEAVDGNSIAWREKLATIFPLPGVSTDYGWNFDRYQQLGLFVGSAGSAPVRQNKTTATIDFTREMSAGFRISDGKPVWRDPGSLYACGYLPCPGQANPSVSRQADGSREPTIGIRLRISGQATYKLTGLSPPLISRKSRVIVEGFDPATGSRRWSFDAGHDTGLMAQTLLPPQTSAASIALRTAGGYREVDLSSGAQHGVPARTVGWCRRMISYRQTKAYNAGNGRALYDYVGQDGLFACTLDGRPAKQPARVPAFIAQLGAESGGLIAWSDKNGFFAAPAA
jgi:hypothetical protein